MKNKLHFTTKLRNIKLTPVTGIVALLLLIMAGLLFNDPVVGKAMVIGYGLVALVAGIRSEETFKLALVALLYAPVAYILKNPLIAGNFAEYAFLFLVFAAISLAKETFAEAKRGMLSKKQ